MTHNSAAVSKGLMVSRERLSATPMSSRNTSRELLDTSAANTPLSSRHPSNEHLSTNYNTSFSSKFHSRDPLCGTVVSLHSTPSHSVEKLNKVSHNACTGQNKTSFSPMRSVTTNTENKNLLPDR